MEIAPQSYGILLLRILRQVFDISTSSAQSQPRRRAELQFDIRAFETTAPHDLLMAPGR